MSQLNRRTVIAATTALGVSSILPARVYAQTVPEIQTLRSTSKSWLWAAEDYANSRGFFDKARVKVVSNASNRGTNVAALAGSGVDIVLGDPGEASRARGEKLAIKSFVSTVNKYASNVVLSNAVLKRLGITEQSPVDRKAAALKGLRLGTTGPGAAPDALFRWLAVQAKLDPNTDLRLVPLQGGGPGMLAALQQNVIDGFCLSSPTSDLAVKDRDCGYLFNMAPWPTRTGGKPWCAIAWAWRWRSRKSTPARLSSAPGRTSGLKACRRKLQALLLTSTARSSSRTPCRRKASFNRMWTSSTRCKRR